MNLKNYVDTYIKEVICTKNLSNKTIKDSLPAFKRLMDRYKGE